MSAPRSVVAVNADFWIRVNLAVEIHLKDALLGVLHNVNNDPSYVGLPTNGHQLNKEMLLFKQQCQQPLRKVVKKNQWDVLCPPSGLSNSKDWDITLIVVVIINVLQLPTPAGGWAQFKPQPGDISLSAFILMARWLRNEIKHGKLSDLLTVSQFNLLWADLRVALLGLKYDSNRIKEFDNLESGTLKLYTAATVKLLEDEQRRLENELVHLKLLEKYDIKILQSQLDNLNVVVKSVQVTNNLSSAAMSMVGTTVSEFDTKMSGIDARVTQLEYKETVYRALSQGDVLDETLSIVVQNLTKPEWEKLIDIFDISYKETIINFRSKAISLIRKKNLSWSELKDRLVQMKRKDIVKKIKAETCITTGLKNAVDDYKENLRQNVLKKKFVKPFLGGTGQTELDDKEIDDAFVELAIITGSDVDKKFLNSNRNYHLQQLVLRKRIIQLKELLTKDDRFVIVCGVPGIGKSTLVKKIILEWEKGKMLSGEENQPNIHLLFPILCRELNTIEANQGESPKELLQRLFPNFFYDWKMMEEMSQHVLFLVDGVDELRSVHDISKQEKLPFVNLLQHLMQPGFLGSHKCILVGRPGTTRMLQCLFRETFEYAAKKVEVCGFSKENVEMYIKKQFVRDIDVGINVLQKVQTSPLADGLSQIPFYAWVITCIFKDNPLTKIPKTVTELLLYSFLVFLRNQEEKNCIVKSRVGLGSLCQDPKIAKYVLGVTEFAFKTLLDNEILFEADDNVELRELEHMGILLKSGRGETGQATYQFQHLTIQELFAAIHILLMDDEHKRSVIEESIMQTSLVLVAGLEGIVFGGVCDSDLILKQFLQNLVVASKRNNLKSPLVTSILEQKWRQTWRFDGDLEKDVMKHVNYKEGLKTVAVNVDDIFIEAFFENQSSTFSCSDRLKGYKIDFIDSPTTAHQFYKFMYFVHVITKSNPSLRLKVFPLNDNIILKDKAQLQCILCCTEAVDISLSSVLVPQKGISDVFISLGQRLTDTVLQELTFYDADRDSHRKLSKFLPSLPPSFLNRVEGLHIVSNLETMERSLFSSNLTVHFSPNSMKKLTLVNCGLTENMLLMVVNSLHSLTHIDVSKNQLLSQLSLCRILGKLLNIKVVMFLRNLFRELTNEEDDEIDLLLLNERSTVIEMLAMEEIYDWYSFDEKIFPFIVRWVRLVEYEHDDPSQDDLLLDILKDMKENNNNYILDKVYFHLSDDEDDSDSDDDFDSEEDEDDDHDYEPKDCDNERFEGLKAKLDVFNVSLIDEFCVNTFTP